MQIKEIAERLHISPRAIRFYEEKGLISPKKQDSSGYRLFTEEDVWCLQTIIVLREVGMSIEMIRELLNQIDKDGDAILSYLEIQRAYMYDRWVEMKNMIQTTESMISQLKADSSLRPASLYELAEANKRLRQVRTEWVDRWNFNEMAKKYDDLVMAQKDGFNPHVNYEQVLDKIVQTVAPKPQEHGLDLGTGTGNLVKRLTLAGAAMSAFDQSMEMLKICKQKNPQVETKLGNFFAIPFLDHSFDFVASSYALHHVTDEQKLLALAECKRVLKPGGRLVIADLMFVDQAAREECLSRLREAGEKEAIAMIEDEYYADRSLLLASLKEMGFSLRVEQMNDYVHLIVGQL